MFKRINFKPILRALSGKNKAGKTIYGILGLGGGYLATESVGMNDTQLLITVGMMVAVFLIGLFVENPKAKEKLEKTIEQVSDEIVKATDDKSDGGSKITRNEWIAIITSIYRSNP